MIKPWKIIDSQQTFKDKFLSVRTDTCVREDGHVVSPYHVVEFSEWVTIVPVTRAGNIVLIREYRHAGQQVMIGLPGGVSDPGESNWEDVGRRELREETGYSCGELHLIGSCYPNPAIQNNQLHYYLALDCERTHEQSLDPNEEIEVIEMPYTEFLNYGAFPAQHALHAAALFYAERWFLQNPERRPLQAAHKTNGQGRNDDIQTTHARSDESLCERHS